MTPKKKAIKDGEDDLAILYPDREVSIAGEKIVMREYGFVEGMRLHPLYAPMLHELAQIAGRDGVDLSALQCVIGAHADDVSTLIATACDRDVAWVRGLNDADGQQLFLTWWLVNKDFFIRRIVQAVQVAAMQRASRGGASTPPSSPTITTHVN